MKTATVSSLWQGQYPQVGIRKLHGLSNILLVAEML